MKPVRLLAIFMASRVFDAHPRLDLKLSKMFGDIWCPQLDGNKLNAFFSDKCVKPHELFQFE